MFNILKSRTLLSVEASVLQLVNEALSPKSKAIFERQISQIANIQRYSDGKEVNLYFPTHGPLTSDRVERFNIPEPEFRLANIAINTHVEAKPLRANVWLAKGIVFSITFDRSPNLLIEDINSSIAHLIIDPATTWQAIPTSDEVREANNFLAEWFPPYKTKIDQTPYTVTPSANYLLSSFHVSAPADYLDFLRRVPGCHIASWVIHRMGNIREIVTESTNYIVVAESDKKWLLVWPEDETSNQFLLWNTEEDRPVPLHATFRASVLSAFARANQAMM